MERLHSQLWSLLSFAVALLHTAGVSLLRSLSFVTDSAVCQPASVCEPRLTSACSDVVYVVETATYTETKVCAVKYMHGQEKMAMKQQYASSKMHTAAVLLHK